MGIVGGALQFAPMPRPTAATIHLDALRHNLDVVRRLAPRSRAMAVVKADAYGHGLERSALALRRAEAFAVAAIADIERIRAAGLTQPVLLLPGIDASEDVARMRQLGADSVIHGHHQIDMLEQAAPGAPIRCWLKVDSGMHRLGFPPGQVRAAHARLASLAAVAEEIALMSHFASSDEFEDAGSANSAHTRRQVQVFDEATAGLPGPRSLSNTCAVLGWPDAHRDWVRPGGALYGLSVVRGRPGPAFGLRPAMTLSTRLLAVNRIARGEPLGYSATWTCPEDMPVGVAAVGYADGYPRHAAPGTPVLVNGRPASVVGRVSMDLTLIDLRGQPQARAGDPVTLWGEGLPADTVAESADTIGYQLTCGITRRVRVLEA